MRTVRLIAISDDYDRSPGLIIKGTPTFDGIAASRGDGSLIAHDLLEHVNGKHNMGPVWDELEALGAVWQVRGRHGDLLNQRGHAWSPAQNLAYDIVRMYEGWTSEAPFGSQGTKAHDYDEDFQQILDYAREYLPKEVNDPRPTVAEIDQYLEFTLHRMRTGFRKAQRKYGSGYTGTWLYIAIRDAVGRTSCEFEGQEFKLRYGVDSDGRATAYCEEVH